MGYKRRISDSFYFTVNQHLNFLRANYRTQYKKKKSYIEKTIKDPLTGVKTKNYETQESFLENSFVLVNADKRDIYYAFEFQLASQINEDWLLSLAASAWYSKGEGSFGVFSGRNDAGVFSEIDADPNSNINRRRINWWFRFSCSAIFK